MKKLTRSNSDTNLFREKEQLDRITYNLKRFKNMRNISKSIKRNITTNDFELSTFDIIQLEGYFVSNLFKSFLINIVKFKKALHYELFNTNKDSDLKYTNLQLELVLIYIKNCKKELKKENIEDECQDEKNGTLRNILEEIGKLIKIVLSLQIVDLFGEIKTKILMKINYLIRESSNFFKKYNKYATIEKNLKEIYLKIIFIFSILYSKTDYYCSALNSLMHKLNYFFIEFIKYTYEQASIEEIQFINWIALIEKIFRVKGEYIREFCLIDRIKGNIINKTLVEDERAKKIFFTKEQSIKLNINVLKEESTMDSKFFSFTQYNNFSIFFLNNLLNIIDLNKKTRPNPFMHNIKNDQLIKIKRDKNLFVKCKAKLKDRNSWKFRSYKGKVGDDSLDRFFKLYFNNKQLKWKSTYVKLNPEIHIVEEKCRICKKSILLKDFARHSYYCKERSLYMNFHEKIAENIDKLVKILSDKAKLFANNFEDNNLYRASSLPNNSTSFNNVINQSSFFISPNVEHRKRLMKHFNNPDKNTKELMDLSILNSSNYINIFDLLLQTISREKDKRPQLYEKDSNKLNTLNSMIHFIFKMISQKQNFQVMKSLYPLFAKILINLLNKQITIENLLAVNDKFNNNYNNYNLTLRKKSSNFSKEIESIINKFNSKSILYNTILSNESTAIKNKPKTSSFKLDHFKGFFPKKENSTEVSELRKSLPIRNPSLKKENLRNISNLLKEQAKSDSPSKFIYFAHRDSPSNEEVITNPEILPSIDSSTSSAFKINDSSFDSFHLSEITDSPNFEDFSHPKKYKTSTKKKSLFLQLKKQDSFPTINECESFIIKDQFNLDSSFLEKDRKETLETESRIDSSDDNSQFSELLEIVEDCANTEHFQDEEIINQQISINDFKFISFIGKGGYGNVNLYKKKDTGDLFAIKNVDLSKFETKTNINNMMIKESEILNEIQNEFLVKCYYIFADKKNYYYVMEYLPGGDLDNLLDEIYSLPHEIIKFVAAEVVLALEYLHSKGIIHKDIKPENILISNKGHIKLADFGLSEIKFKQNKFAVSIYANKLNNTENDINETDQEESIKNDFINYKTFSCSGSPQNLSNSLSDITSGTKQTETTTTLRKVNIPGTPNYTAPETIKGENVTKAVDLWALGVILFELYTNTQPFKDENRAKIYENILNLQVNWELLKSSVKDDDSAYDLIKQFLILDPNERLKNYHKIKYHPYFKNINWDSIKNMDYQYMRGYVKKRIKIFKPKKIENGKIVNEDLDNVNKKHLFCTERVDNLHFINMIEWNKKIKIDYDEGENKQTDHLMEFL